MRTPMLAMAIAILFGVAWSDAAESLAEGEAPKPDADGWYSLFNGKDMTGWKVSEKNADTFQVVDGQIVAHGPPAHLYYDGPVNHAKFKNFIWKCEILTKPHSNSGMYF